LIRKATLSGLFLASLALLAGCGGADGRVASKAEGPPQRIVSMNPCVDAVLMQIADPAQIAAISHYSQDPRATSIPLERALHYPAISDSAEDVIGERPDLVIAGSHVSIQTIAALRRLGIPLMQLTVPESVAENKAQITQIATRIGRTRAGEALNARIDAAMTATRWNAAPIPALIWQGSGLVPGKNTLADELMAHTGFHNISADMGLKKWDILPLEGLLTHPPTVLLAGRADMGAGSGDGNRMLTHPALVKAGKRINIAQYPSNLLHCGGPVIIRSVERLAAVRRAWRPSQ
jgi:iron complex transport system substrate-binding protein